MSREPPAALLHGSWRLNVPLGRTGADHHRAEHYVGPLCVAAAGLASKQAGKLCRTLRTPRQTSDVVMLIDRSAPGTNCGMPVFEPSRPRPAWAACAARGPHCYCTPAGRRGALALSPAAAGGRGAQRRPAATLPVGGTARRRTTVRSGPTCPPQCCGLPLPQRCGRLRRAVAEVANGVGQAACVLGACPVLLCLAKQPFRAALSRAWPYGGWRRPQPGTLRAPQP